MAPPQPDVIGQAADAAAQAAARAGVDTVPARGIDEMRRLAQLFASVWGRTPEGVPIPSELMRSLMHAEGLVSLALDRESGEMVGGAVLGRAGPGAAYSFIAAVAPGTADRGIGFALKQHQRGWALAHGVGVISWTFDPLVSRNGRFNLTKLGARAGEYAPAFYGRMSDAVNGDDLADRMVASWRLDSLTAIRASEGGVEDDPGEPEGLADALSGPDGRAAWVEGPGLCWCRVPEDIVALRRQDPEQATRWRASTRELLSRAFDAGYVAVGASRGGWYRLENEEAP
jgi:predicted GNAT superfamily acetyltransferase